MGEEQYVEDWSELNVAELREELAARNLPTSGKKPELVERLEASDAEDGVPENAGEPTESPVEPDPQPAPVQAASDGPSPATYVAEFDTPDDWDGFGESEDFDNWRIEARNGAVAAGHTPLGGANAARYAGNGSRNGRMTVRFEVPLVPIQEEAEAE